jgi:hypothetical protein
MQVSGGGSRLLHKVGRGRRICNYNGWKRPELLMEVNCVPIRHSTLLCNRQCYVVQLRILPKMMCGTVYSELLFYIDTPIGKRTSRSDQQDPNDNIEKEAQEQREPG